MPIKCLLALDRLVGVPGAGLKFDPCSMHVRAVKIVVLSSFVGLVWSASFPRIMIRLPRLHRPDTMSVCVCLMM